MIYVLIGAAGLILYILASSITFRRFREHNDNEAWKAFSYAIAGALVFAAAWALSGCGTTSQGRYTQVLRNGDYELVMNFDQSGDSICVSGTVDFAKLWKVDFPRTCGTAADLRALLAPDSTASADTTR